LNKPNEGEVVAIGEGYRTREGELIKPTVVIGDKVLLPEFGGVPLKSGDQEYVLFRNDEILAKFLE